ncbi:prepilin-type N-terminal cleavage/methylation domain-containing protein [Pullulanibacillus sp. KACC 23026]|uniref:PilW family protein n=1 Tax=Pullulanibacillus sp. KACC 23026 TaxID=3028315 RepID=UPI0023B1A2FB|nr:prepilin-type N-terminal cleavage/methylation domain-containing protein [Pullulanibacillus sp. KACC 23026]WEG11457.1 prepilin-type N-terminal cleavage/methylation domain-containing protein [Pullulanibacillus sp. KACC 23026]
MEKLKRISKHMSGNQGLTLVEVMATLVILSIVLVMITSIHLLGLKEYNVQSQNLKNQDNVRLAMSLLTKQIRSVDLSDLTVDENNTPANPYDNSLKFVKENVTYKEGTSAINKNGQPVVNGISQFGVTLIGNKVTLTLVSVPDQQGNKVTLSTNLYIRQ